MFVTKQHRIYFSLLSDLGHNVFLQSRARYDLSLTAQSDHYPVTPFAGRYEL